MQQHTKWKWQQEKRIQTGEWTSDQGLWADRGLWMWIWMCCQCSPSGDRHTSTVGWACGFVANTCVSVCSPYLKEWIMEFEWANEKLLKIFVLHILSVQFSSVTLSCLTLCDTMNHSTPGLPVHHQLPESTQTHVHWVSDAIQPSHPLSSPSPPALNLSQHQRLFQWVISSHQVATVLDFQLLHLISFRMDWLDLLAVQGTLRSLLQHHNSKASILLRSAFFMVQLSHPYMTTGKTIALTRRTFVGKVMSLLFQYAV